MAVFAIAAVASSLVYAQRYELLVIYSVVFIAFGVKVWPLLNKIADKENQDISSKLMANYPPLNKVKVDGFFIEDNYFL